MERCVSEYGSPRPRCAALGNVVADSLGQLSGGTVRAPGLYSGGCSVILTLQPPQVDGVLRPHLPNPRLSPAQQASRTVRATQTAAATLGIVVGCLCGCTPLLFLGAAKPTAAPASSKED